MSVSSLMENVSSGLAVSVLRKCFHSFGILSKIVECCFVTHLVLFDSNSLIASVGNIFGMTPYVMCCICVISAFKPSWIKN